MEYENKYASKGVAGAGLGLGIAGTALGLMAGGNGLGSTVALAHLNGGLVVIEELVEFLFQLNGQTVATGENALEKTEVGIFQFFYNSK